MWIRNDAKPTVYKGIQFRSALEAKVAKEFDDLSVEWKYEVPAHQAVSWLQGPYEDAPPQVPYLPDFLIVDAPGYLKLPTWVEVKPAELLYALRDHLGCPEQFDENKRFTISGQEIYSAQIDEIWKPKRAAEIYQRDVLVVSAINRNRMLSILLTSTYVELSKSHPAVNHRELVRMREQRRRDEERRAEWQRREAERLRERREHWTKVIAYARIHSRPAKFSGYCRMCNGSREAALLVIFRDAEGRWIPICRSHLDAT